MPENQAKRIGNEGQNHTNFGLISNLIPEATQVLLLNEELKNLCEYMNTQNAIRARELYMLI